ncbi:MAG: hypothetical protein COV36_00250 [Alphaproteobacteria bacterium CG11_big_fil_rev_8_21_14_0_20_44_7]|nr:MAG: hypothetical protein COV36_00250 [Alphaproteobacteria bacterium CG11_big_fil_rev_8_21_14_0_20_44_7]
MHEICDPEKGWEHADSIKHGHVFRKIIVFDNLKDAEICRQTLRNLTPKKAVHPETEEALNFELAALGFCGKAPLTSIPKLISISFDYENGRLLAHESKDEQENNPSSILVLFAAMNFKALIYQFRNYQEELDRVNAQIDCLNIPAPFSYNVYSGRPELFPLIPQDITLTTKRGKITFPPDEALTKSAKATLLLGNMEHLARNCDDFVLGNRAQER